MKKLIFLSFILLLALNANAQSFSATIGTDIPYQHYLGINMELKNIDISYRTGILVPPYSDAILGIIQGLGTDEIYQAQKLGDTPEEFAVQIAQKYNLKPYKIDTK